MPTIIREVRVDFTGATEAVLIPSPPDGTFYLPQQVTLHNADSAARTLNLIRRSEGKVSHIVPARSVAAGNQATWSAVTHGPQSLPDAGHSWRVYSDGAPADTPPYATATYLEVAP